MNNVLTKLLEIPEAQRLNLRLMELASFNDFNGKKVVKSLLDNRDLWKACFMDREAICLPELINKMKRPSMVDLIRLRDLSRGIWNVDTLYILAKEDKKSQEKLEKLAKTWLANEVEWLDPYVALYLLGGGSEETKVLRIWWS